MCPVCGMQKHVRNSGTNKLYNEKKRAVLNFQLML